MRYSAVLDKFKKTGQRRLSSLCFPFLKLSTDADFAGLTLGRIIDPEYCFHF